LNAEKNNLTLIKQEILYPIIQMTKYISRLLIASALIASSLCTIHADETPANTPIQLASDVWPPFTNHFGKPRLATEIVHLALTKAGYAPTTKILDAWTVPSDLKANKYDGCGALWKSDDREAYLLFSQPYLESRIHLVGQKGNDVSITDLSKLKGVRLALVKGYAYGDLLASLDGVEIIYGSDDVANLKMLVHDEADYTLVDDLLIQHAKKEYPETCEASLAFGKQALLINPIYLALRKNLPNVETIIKKFNQTIRLMQADGTYNRILRLNSLAIDIDGDGVQELVLSDINLSAGAPSSGYQVFTKNQKLPPKKRYSIGATIYEDWDKVPSDFQNLDNALPDTRRRGLNLFGGDF
jgi:polar amino acid transport system substrate-binding protein